MSAVPSESESRKIRRQIREEKIRDLENSTDVHERKRREIQDLKFELQNQKFSEKMEDLAERAIHFLFG